MQPEERAVLDLLQSWSPDVTGLLHRAGYFDLDVSTTKKEEIAQKIGFGRGSPLYKKLQASSLEKNWEVAKIVLDEANLIELKQGARQVAKQLGLEFSEFDWDPIAQKYMKEHGFQLVKTLTQTDLKRIVPIMQQHFGLNERTFAKRFRENYPCSEYRMKTIFRTEKFTAINGGAHGLALEAGATTKIWRHSHGPNPRKDHLAMDGEEQPIDKPFSNGKQFPGGDPNCRCRADYSFGGEGKAWRAKAQARMVGSRAPEPRRVASMVGLPQRLYEVGADGITNKDNLNRFMSRVDTLINDFPATKDKFGGFRSYDNVHTPERVRHWGGGAYATDWGTVYDKAGNPVRDANGDIIRKIFIYIPPDNMNNGLFAKDYGHMGLVFGGDLDHVATHEFGHVVHKTATSKFGSSAESKVFDATDEALKQSGITQRMIKKNVSLYADGFLVESEEMKKSERFAELFTAIHSEPPADKVISKEFQKRLSKFQERSNELYTEYGGAGRIV